MTFRLGLTGSIGMGKSTTAKLFKEEGCAVWDADDCVARLYAIDGAGTKEIAKHFDGISGEGGVDRDALRALIRSKPETLKVIEGLIHPLVRKDREDFAQSTHAIIAVFDIPLLFETGAETEMDAVACVSISPELQEKRVLDRGTMTKADFDLIRGKQMPNDEKVSRSDYVIVTDTLAHAQMQVQGILEEIRSK